MKKNNLKRNTVSKPLTERVLGQYLEKVIKRVDRKIDETKKVLESKIGETKKVLEAKIEYSRKDASEQIHSVKKAVNARIDALDVRIDALDVRIDALDVRIDQAIKELKEDIQLNRAAIKSVKEDIVDMESHLSGKIDTIGVRLEEHESKPPAIAHPS